MGVLTYLLMVDYTNSKNSIISFGYVDFKEIIFPILYPLLETSTTHIAISCSELSLLVQCTKGGLRHAQLILNLKKK